jgi:hypothetical protein
LSICCCHFFGKNLNLISVLNLLKETSSKHIHISVRRSGATGGNLGMICVCSCWHIWSTRGGFTSKDRYVGEQILNSWPRFHIWNRNGKSENILVLEWKQSWILQNKYDYHSGHVQHPLANETFGNLIYFHHQF